MISTAAIVIYERSNNFWVVDPRETATMIWRIIGHQGKLEIKFIAIRKIKW